MNPVRLRWPSVVGLTYALPALLLGTTSTTQWAAPIYMTLACAWAVTKSIVMHQYISKAMMLVTFVGSWIIAAIAFGFGLFGLVIGTLVHHSVIGLLLGLWVGVGIGGIGFGAIGLAIALGRPSHKGLGSMWRLLGLTVLQGFAIAIAVILGGLLVGWVGIAIAIVWGIIVTMDVGS